MRRRVVFLATSTLVGTAAVISEQSKSSAKLDRGNTTPTVDVRMKRLFSKEPPVPKKSVYATLPNHSNEKEMPPLHNYILMIPTILNSEECSAFIINSQDPQIDINYTIRELNNVIFDINQIRLANSEPAQTWM